MIILRGVSKAYGQDKEISDISLTAKEDGVTVLLGPAGSGKSTVCEILCGVIAPDSGSVLIDGCDLEKDPIEAKRHIGYMPQDPAVFRDMTPRGQLKFIGQAHEMSARALNERVEQVIRQTKIAEVADRPIRLLPEAYLQRIGIAQAIMGQVENIVIDAPTKPLDAKQTYELRSILKEIIPGHTVLLATDNLTEAALLGDSVYLMDNGRIVGKADMKQLAELRADSEKTIVSIAADAAQVEKALSGCDLKHEIIAEQDGLVRVQIETGLGIEGRKQASAYFAKEGLAIVEMRPAERCIEQILMQLENEPFASEGAEAE